MKIELDDKMVFKDIELPRGSLTVADEEVLYKYGNGLVLEIGTFFGRSAILLAQKATKVVTIDRFTGRGDYPDFNYENVQQQITKFIHSEKIDILKGSSVEFRGFFEKELFDVLFIDGSHDLIDVEQDFKLFSPSVKKDGYILFHDYCEIYPQIVSFCNDLKKELKFVENKGMIVVFQK